MRRSLAKFSESEVSNHTPSLADFTTTTPELKFSVHTGAEMPILQERPLCAARAHDQADRDAGDHALCLGPFAMSARRWNAGSINGRDPLRLFVSPPQRWGCRRRNEKSG